MQARAGPTPNSSIRFRLDRLGLVIAILIAAAVFQPFATLRPNRIAAAAPVELWHALPFAQWIWLCGLSLLCVLIMVVRTKASLRFLILSAALFSLLFLMGSSGTYLTPIDNNYARISPGSGFWLLLFALSLAIGDSVVKLNLKPLMRILVLGIFGLGFGAILYFGVWNDLSILKEYASYRLPFMNALSTHVMLAGGSLCLAVLIAFPVGTLIYNSPRLREAVLSVLNVIQTIPSMALFGVLIAPLAWVGTNLPGAAALGIAGIGPAPALIALIAYALLPITLATVTGLAGVPSAITEAAEGIGMTRVQRLLKVEIPLAFPVILTGIRVVLVQNIGLTVIAGLVGGGGLGTFIFQGLSQTATDLILLGALPTIAMAFSAAIIFDALIEISRRRQVKSERGL